jgi:ubiquinone/menaquinone biosynthesis C-methylase UbiE
MKPRAVARLLGVLFVLFAVPASSPGFAGGLVATPAFSERFTPFVPTPYSVVEKMLELAGVGPDDTVYDLGSGDGRIVIAAAKDFGARAVGVEIRSELWKRSSEEIVRRGLEKRARVIHDDMFQVNVGAATVVTLYQLTTVNDRLRPLLEKSLRPGTRIVSVDFEIPDWTPAKTLRVKAENGDEYKLYLYVRQ